MPTKEEIMLRAKREKLTGREIAENGWMCSVTQRIKFIKQPWGGYLPPKEFEQIVLPGGGAEDLSPEENVSPGLIGTAVDYLTRFMSGSSIRDVFRVSEMGAMMVQKTKLYYQMLVRVHDLSDESIYNAVRMCGFDVVFRAGPIFYRPVEDISPNEDTIQNIRTMVYRSLEFFGQFGPKVLDGLTFEGGYTGYVASGDGDFITKDTLWDFKTSKQKLQSKHTLQLLMYWRMGLHSVHPEYKSIRYLGIFNPRTNTVYRIDINNIPAHVIDEVEGKVIGYDKGKVEDS